MNQKEFNEVIVRQTDHCKSMLVVKGAEYAPRAVKNTAVDRLAHFKKRHLWGCCPSTLSLYRICVWVSSSIPKSSGMRRSPTVLTIS